MLCNSKSSKFQQNLKASFYKRKVQYSRVKCLCVYFNRFVERNSMNIKKGIILAQKFIETPHFKKLEKS